MVKIKGCRNAAALFYAIAVETVRRERYALFDEDNVCAGYETQLQPF